MVCHAPLDSALELDLHALGLAGVEPGVAGGADPAPDLDLVPGAGARGREEQRHAVGVVARLVAAVRVLEAGVERRRGRRIDQLRTASSCRAGAVGSSGTQPSSCSPAAVALADAQVAGRAAWSGSRTRCLHTGKWVREPYTRVQAVERPLEPRDLGQVGEVGDRSGDADAQLVRAQVRRLVRRRGLLVGVDGEPAGAEQRRVLPDGSCASRPPWSGSPAPRRSSPAARGSASPRSTASAGRSAASCSRTRPRRCCRRAASPRRTGSVSVRVLWPVAWSELHAASSRLRYSRGLFSVDWCEPIALRGDVVAVVGLVPDRPEVHARKRGRRAPRLVGPAVAGADRLARSSRTPWPTAPSRPRK